MKETQLVPTVETILSLMEMITTALWCVCVCVCGCACERAGVCVCHCVCSELVHSYIRLISMTTAYIFFQCNSSSSSLRVLAAHTDSIKVEVQTVLSVSRKVAEECSIRSIKDDVVDSLSNIEALSHQLCLVTKVKLKHCQGR